jgi:hypothetical protein
MALQYVIYPTRRYFDAVMASQIPADSDQAKMISALQRKDLFFNGEHGA